jgi:electron transport complex protein RnfA
MLTEIFFAAITTIFIQNIVLAQFLGIRSAVGTVSKVRTANSMGLATLFVIVISSLLTWALQTYVLVPLELEYLRILAFTLIIVTIVQFVEIALSKTTSPLAGNTAQITVNSAVLGVTLLVIQNGFGFIETLQYSIFASLGFWLIIVIMAGIQERLEASDIPEFMKGFPITLVTLGLVAMAFMAFTGLVS